MGLFGKRDTHQPRPFDSNGGYVNMPHFAHQCMTRNAVDVRCTKYFEGIISKLPTLQRIHFKVLKATKKNTPENWNIEPDDYAVFTEAGEFIGTINKSRLEKLGGKTGKKSGFVEPPSYDFRDGVPITQSYRVFLIRSYNEIFEEAVGVEVGWKP